MRDHRDRPLPPPPTGQPLAAPPPPPAGPRLESLTRLGNFAAVGVSAVAAYEALVLVAALIVFLSGSRPGALVLFSLYLPLLWILLALAGVPFVIWFHRAYARLPLLGVTTRFRPGMAIACWFIPFANWVLPAMIGDEIWRAGRPPGRRSDGVVWNLARVWWGFYLGTGLLVLSPLFIIGSGADRRFIACWILASAALLLVSAGLAVAFVRRAGERLDGLEGLAPPGDALDRAIHSVYAILPIPPGLAEVGPDEGHTIAYPDGADASPARTPACGRCGALEVRGANFCGGCGAPLG